MYKFLFILLFPLVSFAQVPQSWVTPNAKVKGYKNANQEILSKRLVEIINFNQSILNDKRMKSQANDFNLNRVDVAIGASLSGSIGILGLGKSSTLEYIWKRKKKFDAQIQDIEIDVQDEAQVKRKLRDHLLSFLSRYHMSEKKRQRIIKRIDKMTQESSEVLDAMVSMPQVGAWQASSLFKDFYFSANGDLLEVAKLGYDTRLRFRFKLKGTPYAQQDFQSLNRVQKRMYKFMKELDEATLSAKDSKNFSLKTVAVKSSFKLGADLQILSVKAGQGFDMRFDRVESYEYPELVAQEIVESVNKLLMNPTRLERALMMSESLVVASDQDSAEAQDFELKTIKAKFSFDVELGVSLVSLEKSSGLEFYYERQ